MSQADDLFDQQHQFLRVICHQNSDYLTEALIPAGSLSANEALNVYVQDYWLRLPAALADLFPSVAQALSQDEFGSLCCDYLRLCPSQHYNLDLIGENLPGFISQHILNQTYPYLADLAELEKAYLKCFHAPEWPEPDWNLLETYSAEYLHLDLIPDVYRFQSRFDLLSLWVQSNLKDIATQQNQLNEFPAFLVYRHPQGVRYLRLNQIQNQLFQVFQHETSIEKALDQVSLLITEFDPLEISRFFVCLRQEKLLKSIYIK